MTSPLTVPAAPVAGADAPPTSHRRAVATLVALSAAAFFVVTNEVSPVGLIGPMSEALGKSESQIGLASMVFAIANMVATIPLALLTTRMVRKWVIVAALIVWTGGVLIAATADTFTELLISRGVSGTAHALFWVVVTPAAAGMFPLAQRGKSVARLLIGTSITGVVGLPAATWLAQREGWHAPYWVLAGAGAVLAVVVAILMPSFRTLQSTVATGDFPSRGRFTRVLLITGLTTTAMAVTWTYISPFVTDVAGFADASVPVVLMCAGVVGMVSMFLTGRYLDRWPVKAVVLGQVLLLIMWAGLAVGGASKPVTLVMVCVQALGWSMLVAGQVNWALRHTPWASDIGNGTYAAVFNLGNSLGAPIGGFMLAQWGPRWLPLASLALTAAAFVLALTARRLRPMLRAARAARSAAAS